MSGRKPGVFKEKPSNTSGIHKGFEAENCWSPCCKARAVNPLPTMWPSDWDKDAKKGRLTHHLTEDNSRKARPPHKSHCALTQRPGWRGSFTNLLMQIKECLFSPAADCDSAIIKRDPWKGFRDAGRFECQVSSSRIIYSPVAIRTLSLSPSAEPPFSSPLIGPLIILSHR